MKRTDISSAVRRANSGKVAGTFYVYEHTRQSDGKVFYVGKGVGNRAYATDRRSGFWKNVYAKHGRDVRIVACFDREEQAFEYERLLIARYTFRGYQLCNLTAGGEGAVDTADRRAAKRALKLEQAKVELRERAASRPDGKPGSHAYRRVRKAQAAFDEADAVLRCRSRLPSFEHIARATGLAP